MTGRQKIQLGAVIATYVAVVLTMALDARRAASTKERLAGDMTVFSRLMADAPPPPIAVAAREPLLIRMQKSVEGLGLKDRAPKLSAVPTTPGAPPQVSLSMEGVPFDRIVLLLEGISGEPDVQISSFRIERSGGSDERFDFSATFIQSTTGVS